MSALMIPAVLFTFIAPNENQEIVAPKNLKEAVIGPLLDFFHRKGAWIFLLFILLYKVGDSMASNMTTPFILDIGYTKTDIASVAKTFGMLATIIGGIFGGMLMLRMNLKWALTIFGVFQAISTLGFAVLPTLPIGFSSLALVIAVENLASGMGTAAYSAYMASLTNKRFTATQYALLTALMGVPRVILSSPTGLMAESMGWQMFFVFCTVIALPGMLLLYPMFKFAPGEIPNSNIKIQNNFENPKVKLVAYLQIIGPILLLCTMCYLYFKASEVTEITAFQLIPFLIMTSSGVLSALAGVYLLKKKEIGIKLTIINLSLQIINFSFKGVSWIYLLGIGYLVNYTGTNSGSKFGFSYSLINFNYFVNLMPDFNDPNVFISVNFFPITLIILLMKGTQTKTNS
jgi:MFS family permease